MKGNIILEDEWITGSKFSEGLLAIEMKDKSGFINTKGEFVIEADFNIEYSTGPKTYAWINYYFNEGYALVENGKKCFLYNKKGKKRSP